MTSEERRELAVASDESARLKKQILECRRLRTIGYYCLHIQGGYEEIALKLGELHDLPYLTVYVVDLGNGQIVEITATCNRQYWSGGFGEITAVPPRGRGWKLLDCESDNFTS